MATAAHPLLPPRVSKRDYAQSASRHSLPRRLPAPGPATEAGPAERTCPLPAHPKKKQPARFEHRDGERVGCRLGAHHDRMVSGVNAVFLVQAAPMRRLLNSLARAACVPIARLGKLTGRNRGSARRRGK